MSAERSALVVCLACCVLTAVPLAAPAADAGGAPAVSDRVGVARGICVVLDGKECKLALDLARGGEATIFAQVPAADLAAAREAVDAAGLYGRRVFVEAGGPAHIPLADNLADAVVAAADVPEAARAEVLRVLRPGGRAALGGQLLVKPLAEGADDWSHPYHGPDNNPQSSDQLARAPYVTQFVAEPRYGPAPQAAVAAAGRVFMAFGHVAWHQREEPVMDTLIAMNGYNGTILWKRSLPPGIMVDRCTMIAAGETLYLADDKSCKLLDAATGKVLREIVAPEKLTGGTFWKWMALSRGVLYALVGADEKPDAQARWRRTGHGWPWNGISNGYNQGAYDWGFARTLLAIDPATGKVLWHHSEDQLIDSRALCVGGERIFLSSFGHYIACLNASDGRELWRRTPSADPELFAAIGKFLPGHGYITGWKSTAYARCSDKALYFVGPQVQDLTAVAAEDGRHLWTVRGSKNVHVLIRGDGLYTIGAQGTKDESRKLDPLTGAVLASFPVRRRACTRATGTVDSILYRSHGDGTERLNLADGGGLWISPMRPSCNVGVIVANGHLYWVPWVCDCNLQMFGAICCGPAGALRTDEPSSAGRLVTGAGPAEPAALGVAGNDWPTYRGDNARTGRTGATIAPDAKVLWKWQSPAPFEPTAPVAAGGIVVLGGSDGIVRAMDAATGRARWRAYTGGGIGYPPALAEGRALVGSGDGWAYALEAGTGRLLWRFRAAPGERLIPVYGSLLSTWPVAGGVVVDGATAYLAAGLNNFDGTHVYALEAATGKVKWHNGEAGSPPAGGGPAVQGDLLLHEGRLYLAGGSAASPAVFDAATGKCVESGASGRRGRELRLAEGTDRAGKGRSGVDVYGQPLYSLPSAPVYDKSTQWKDAVVEAANARLAFEQRDAEGAKAWHLVARDRAGKAELWAHRLDGEPVRWGLAVDAAGRVFVTLSEGKVLCFGRD